VNWTGEPIKIELAVNKERRITFPADIFVEYDKVTDSALQRIRIQIVKNTAYLKATGSVPSSRLIIGEISSQKRYLLDVKAVRTSKHLPRVVVEDGANSYAANPDSSAGSRGPMLRQGDRSAGYVGLIRFAAKELYAPDRLRGTDKNITRTSVTRKRVHHLIRDHFADTRPVGAWKSGGLYVTALSVKNTTSSPLFLDPRNVRGAWKAVSFQNNRLEAKGTNGDNTALYVVSDLPFSQAIRGYAIRVGGMHK
jgi:integrating conjugative element protein (TIGR03749 family)